MAASNPSIPGNEGEPAFNVGAMLSIFEAACVYRDAHPKPKFLGNCDFASKPDCALAERLMGFLRIGGTDRGSARASEEYVEAVRTARDVYAELIDAVEAREIAPVRRGVFTDRTLNPFRTYLHRNDLVAIARRRGDGGTILRGLIAEADSDSGEPSKEEVADDSQKGRPQTQRVKASIRRCFPDGVPIGVGKIDLRKRILADLAKYPVRGKGLPSERVINRALDGDAPRG